MTDKSGTFNFTAFGANSGSGSGSGSGFGASFGTGTNSGSGTGASSSAGVGTGFGTSFGSGAGTGASTSFGSMFGNATTAGASTATGAGGLFGNANKSSTSISGAGVAPGSGQSTGSSLFGNAGQQKLNLGTSASSNPGAAATTLPKFAFNVPASVTTASSGATASSTVPAAPGGSGISFGSTLGDKSAPSMFSTNSSSQASKPTSLFGSSLGVQPAMSANSSSTTNLFGASTTAAANSSDNKPATLQSSTFSFAKPPQPADKPAVATSAGGFSLGTSANAGSSSSSGISFGSFGATKPPTTATAVTTAATTTGTAAAAGIEKKDGTTLPSLGTGFGSNMFGAQKNTIGATESKSNEAADTKPPTSTSTTGIALGTGSTFSSGLSLPGATKPSGPSTTTAAATTATATATATPASDTNKGGLVGQTKIKDAVTDISTSLLDCNSLGDIVDNWTKELTEQIKLFHNQAVEASNCELQLIQQGEQLTKLYELSSKAETEQAVLDQSLDYMEAQQQTLIDLLDAYEPITRELVNQTSNNTLVKQMSNQVGLRRGENSFGAGSGAGVNASVAGKTVEEERDEVYSNAERLNAQIDEISKCLTGLVEEANNISELSSVVSFGVGVDSGNTAGSQGQGQDQSQVRSQLQGLSDIGGGRDPILVISKILNAHLTTLENLESQTTALDERIQMTESIRSRINDEYSYEQQPPVRSAQLNIDIEGGGQYGGSVMGSARKNTHYDNLGHNINRRGSSGDILGGRGNLGSSSNSEYYRSRGTDLGMATANSSLSLNSNVRVSSYSSPFATRSSPLVSNINSKPARDFTPLRQSSTSIGAVKPNAFNNSLLSAAQRTSGSSAVNSSPFHKFGQNLSTPNNRLGSYNPNQSSTLSGRFGAGPSLSSKPRNWM